MQKIPLDVWHVIVTFLDDVTVLHDIGRKDIATIVEQDIVRTIESNNDTRYTCRHVRRQQCLFTYQHRTCDWVYTQRQLSVCRLCYTWSLTQFYQAFNAQLPFLRLHGAVIHEWIQKFQDMPHAQQYWAGHNIFWVLQSQLPPRYDCSYYINSQQPHIDMTTLFHRFYAEVEDAIRRCVLCLRPLRANDGHSALPIKEGRCCDACNYRVIATRIEVFHSHDASSPCEE